MTRVLLNPPHPHPSCVCAFGCRPHVAREFSARAQSRAINLTLANARERSRNVTDPACGPANYLSLVNSTRASRRGSFAICRSPRSPRSPRDGRSTTRISSLSVETIENNLGLGVVNDALPQQRGIAVNLPFASAIQGIKRRASRERARKRPACRARKRGKSLKREESRPIRSSHGRASRAYLICGASAPGRNRRQHARALRMRFPGVTAALLGERSCARESGAMNAERIERLKRRSLDPACRRGMRGGIAKS